MTKRGRTLAGLFTFAIGASLIPTLLPNPPLAVGSIVEVKKDLELGIFETAYLKFDRHGNASVQSGRGCKLLAGQRAEILAFTSDDRVVVQILPFYSYGDVPGACHAGPMIKVPISKVAHPPKLIL